MNWISWLLINVWHTIFNILDSNGKKVILLHSIYLMSLLAILMNIYLRYNYAIINLVSWLRNYKFNFHDHQKDTCQINKNNSSQPQIHYQCNCNWCGPMGEKVNVAMYAKTWEEVDIGQIYICHHLQIDKNKIKIVNQLRTLQITSFMKSLVF